MVEVIGMVTNTGAIMAAAYRILREDRGPSFGEPPRHIHTGHSETTVTLAVVSTDLQLYNEALKVVQDFPQFYPFEVAG